MCITHGDEMTTEHHRLDFIERFLARRRLKNAAATWIILDGYGVIDPQAALDYAARKGYRLAGLQVYCIGADISLCEWVNGQIVLTPGRAAWLQECHRLGLKVILNYEVLADGPDLGAPEALHDGPIIVDCVKAALGAGVPKSLFTFNGSDSPQVFSSCDAVVTSWPNVDAYYGTLVHICEAAGDDADEYGQASVYLMVKGEGVLELWKAPDGTNDVPAGTVWVQDSSDQPDVGGVTCDVNFLTAEGVALWVTAETPKGTTVATLPELRLGDGAHNGLEEAVRAWQGALHGNAWGSELDPPLSVTGYFGPETEEATRRLQTTPPDPLPGTGVADGATYEKCFRKI